MSYVDGFVLAVPTARKDDYRAHAAQFAAVFREYGAHGLEEYLEVKAVLGFEPSAVRGA
jgi:uncharacterized protein YbaA (DUF1428 family)